MRDRRRAWTLAVLFLLNTLNFFDRNVLGALVEPLRRDWALTDAQIGAIGTAFTLLYAASGCRSDAWPTPGGGRPCSGRERSSGAR